MRVPEVLIDKKNKTTNKSKKMTSKGKKSPKRGSRNHRLRESIPRDTTQPAPEKTKHHVFTSPCWTNTRKVAIYIKK
jgi:hypothetical protein